MILIITHKYDYFDLLQLVIIAVVYMSFSIKQRICGIYCCYIHIFKPIFHCDAKTFALGPCVGHNFALGIPTCWYLKTLKFELP